MGTSEYISFFSRKQETLSRAAFQEGFRSIYLQILKSIGFAKISKIFRVGPNLKICWFAITQVCVFEYTRWLEKVFHILRWKR